MSEASDLTALQKVAAAQTAPVSRFNTELVRSAWYALRQRRREAYKTTLRAVSDEIEPSHVDRDPLAYAYIKELWTDHVIVSCEDGGETDGFLRIPYTVSTPGTSVDDVKFGAPQKVRMEFVAASASKRAGALQDVLGLRKESSTDREEGVALARVRTMAGSRRYRKPIGSQLGTGAPGGDALKTVAKTGSNAGANATADKLRSSIKDVAREKTYKGGKVFGDIGNEGKLKSALGQIERLPDGKRGAAAAEVVKAAQALGLTAMVPASVKRLYRQYIAQGPIKNPAKAPKAKGK